MHNYRCRVPLKGGKVAFAQRWEFAEAAKPHIRRITAYWTAPSYFYHLQPGGHLAALKVHLGRKWFGKVDLSRFFSHITRNRIIRSLIGVGYSFREAMDFAVASTVFDPSTGKYVLPYGFVQSPILASVDLNRSALGNYFRSIPSEMALSVYVDDIIISSDNRIAILDGLNKLVSAAKVAGLSINHAKKVGPSPEVTAFNIRMSQEPLAIIEDRLSVMEQLVNARGAGPASDGVLRYVQSVNDNQAEEMRQRFPQIFD
jgi:hypothetical protein